MTDHDFLADSVANVGAKLDAESPRLASLAIDRWAARSVLQKAIRRGEADLAQRAALTLANHDPRSAWRALVIIALEDVGVGSFDTVAEVVALARSATTRRRIGPEAELVRYAARTLSAGWHCQATCDLLMRAANDPRLATTRADMADATSLQRLELLQVAPEPVVVKAAAVLACLDSTRADVRAEQITATITILAGDGLLAQIARAAWQTTRNEMALLFPLVVRERGERGHGDSCGAFDELPDSSYFGDIPSFGLDQFTRVGKAAIRKLIAADPPLRTLLAEVQVETGDWARVVGDALFLVEGGLVGKRLRWSLGDELRLPFRPLPGAFKLRSGLGPVAERTRELLPLLDEFRGHLLFHHDTASSPPQTAQTRTEGSLRKLAPLDPLGAGGGEPLDRWKDYVDSQLPFMRATSELGPVPQHDALVAVAQLCPGSRPGWVLAPVRLCESSFSPDQLVLESYTLENVPIDTIPTCVELDRAKLEALIRRELTPKMPVAVLIGKQLHLFRNAEDAWARKILGDNELVVKIFQLREPREATVTPSQAQ